MNELEIYPKPKDFIIKTQHSKPEINNNDEAMLNIRNHRFAVALNDARMPLPTPDSGIQINKSATQITFTLEAFERVTQNLKK